MQFSFHHSQFNYLNDPNTCLIIADGDPNSQGIMKRVTPEISTILGYRYQELIGQSINVLMPKILADIHDSFVVGFFNTGT